MRKEDIDMKKNYLKPDTMWMNIEIQHMVCDSLEVNGETNQESDLLTRDYDNWDE